MLIVSSYAHLVNENKSINHTFDEPEFDKHFSCGVLMLKKCYCCEMLGFFFFSIFNSGYVHHLLPIFRGSYSFKQRVEIRIRITWKEDYLIAMF